MNFEFEIKELQRRVGDLEGAVSVLTGHLSTVSPKLTAFQDMADTRFEKLSQSLATVLNRVDVMNTQMWSLRDDLPDLIRAALSRGGPRGN